VPPELLSLELTESAALFDDRGAVRQLHVREAGVNLSIDDFGTGYSSRMRVLDLPISTIKLDRSLTQRLPTDRRVLAVAKSTMDMAVALGIAVIAEGIEQPQQRDTLLELGCRLGQGFLFGKAVPAQEVTAAFRASPSGSTRRADAARPRVTCDTATVRSHAVHVYDRVEELTAGVLAYLLPALQGAGAALVVAGTNHRVSFAAALRRLPIDLPVLTEQGRYVALDTDEVLATVMIEGRADGARFRAVVVGLIDDLYREHGWVRVYSETTARLWADGRAPAALELEEEPDDVAASGAVSLYCACPRDVLDGSSDAWAAVLSRHTRVIRDGLTA
jgi:hypothetical protein